MHDDSLAGVFENRTPPAPTLRTRTVQTLTLPLPGGRVLHVGMTRDESGAPEDIAIAAGWVSGSDAMRALASGLTVPASALPALRDALTAMEQAR